MSSIRLLLLGTPSVERDGIPLRIPRRKALALLAYLVLARESSRRDELAALLWPDHGEAEEHSGRGMGGG